MCQKKQMEKVVIPVPPIEIQQEIVSILDCFADLECELEHKLEREYDLRKTQYTYYRDLLLTPKPMQIKMMKLKDIATEIYRGNGIQRNNVTSEGIPCVRYGEIYTTYNTWFDKCVSHTKLEYVSSPRYFEHGDILFAITGENIEDIAKSVAYVGNEKCLAGSDIVVMKHNQNPKYLAYALSTYDARKQKGKRKTKGKVVHSNVKSIENIEIPVPPLEIQQRIVDVLDNFESICNDLSIGLPAEITSRKAQYEYYRDALLNYAETGIYRAEQSRAEQSRAEQSRAEQSRAEQSRADCTIRLIQYVFGSVTVYLKDIANFSYGYTDKAKDEGPIRFIRIKDISEQGCLIPDDKKYIDHSDKCKNYFVNNGDILVARTGATYGKTLYVETEEPSVYASFLMKLDLDQNYLLNRYYWHFTKSSDYWDQANNLVSTGGQPQFNANALSKILITIPPLDKQKEIVHILDQFDDLCNGISSGLPAEIEKRNQQYIYFREKLLNFNERK